MVPPIPRQVLYIRHVSRKNRTTPTQDATFSSRSAYGRTAASGGSQRPDQGGRLGEAYHSGAVRAAFHSGAVVRSGGGSGSGGAGGARGGGEALVDRHLGERREALGDEAQHLVGAVPGGREPRGAAGGALQAAPAAADERAGVEVALGPADAADHVVEELVGERRVDEVGAPHRRRWSAGGRGGFVWAGVDGESGVALWGGAEYGNIWII